MKAKRLTYLVCCWLVGAWLGLATAAQTPNGVSAPVKRTYRILPGDELSTMVKDLPDFAWEGEVDAAGRLVLPFLAQPVAALCRTTDEVAQELTQRYQKIIRKPQVEVAVIASVDKTEPPLLVGGAVRAAGRFLLNRQTRLSEVLSAAGGVTEKANGTVRVVSTFDVLRCDSDGTLVRHAADNLSPAVYAVAEILHGKPTTDPLVYAGDVVTVLERDLVYLNGGLNAPQAIAFRPGLTLTQALAQNGGLTPDSNMSGVRLLRRGVGQKHATEMILDVPAIKNVLKPDMPLQPNDVVIVPCVRCRGRSEYCHTCTQTGGADALDNLKNLPLKVIE